MRQLLGFAVRLRPLALLGHQLAELALVDRETLLRSHFQRQFDREPVGVVQSERGIAGHRGAAVAPDLLHRGVEDRGAGRERAQERLFLGVGDHRDTAVVGRQLRVRGRHAVTRDRQQVRQHGLVHTEQPHRSHRAAHDPPQHVTAALVRGRDAVTDQHQRGADVIGHDAQPDVVGVRFARRVAGVLAVGLARHRRREVEHRAGLVDLVHVVDALQQRSPSAPYPCRCRCSCAAGQPRIS